MKTRASKFMGLLISTVMLFNSFCVNTNAETRPKRFSRVWGIGGDVEFMLGAEYDGKLYVMGARDGNGMTAEAYDCLPDYSFAVDADKTVMFTAEDVKKEKVYQAGWQSWKETGYVKNDDFGYITLKNGKLAYTDAKDEALSTWSAGWFNSSASWVYEFVDYSGSGKDDYKIVLDITSDTPYFTVAESTDDTHIETGVYEERCNHPNMLYFPEKPASCKKDGTMEYYYCPDCGGKFSDAQGYTYFNGDGVIASYGAVDNDHDGKCDDCGKFLPVYRRVKSKNEVFAGGSYLLVTEIDGKLYALKNSTEGGEGLQTVEIEPDARGDITFNEMLGKGAMRLKLYHTAEFSSLDDGITRYSIVGLSNEGTKGLMDSRGYFMWEDAVYAKYGYRITQNTDNSAYILSVFNETWEESDGTLFAYISGEGGNGGKDGKDDKDDKDGKTEESGVIITDHTDSSVLKYPLYFYHQTESGSVGDISYTWTDTASDFTDDCGIVDENISGSAVCAAVGESVNVSGMQDAVSQETINKVINEIAEEAGITDEVNVSVSVDLNVSNCTPSGDATYVLAPKLNYTLNNNGVITVKSKDLDDSAFDGETEMTVTLYTYGIKPSVVIHEKNDGTKECFYDQYSEFANGTNKTFEYTECGGEYSYGFVTFKVTEFSKMKIFANIPGDLDSNGTVNKADAERLLKYICQTADDLQISEISAGKITDNEKSAPDIRDVIEILNIAR